MSLLACAAVLAAPAADATPAASGRATWFLSAGVYESWYQNVRFQSATGANTGDLMSQPSANVSYSRGGLHRSLALSAGATAILFRRLTQFNRVHYNASATGTTQLSRSATLNGQAGSTTSYPFDAQDLADAGLPLPLVSVRTDTGAASLTDQLTRHTRAIADLRYRRVSFDSPVIPGAAYLTGALTLNRNLGRGNDVFLSSRYTVNRSGGRGGDVTAINGGWSRELSRGLTATGGGGAVLIRPVGGSSRRLNFSASAALAAQFRFTTFGVEYTRSVGQAVGLGRDRIADLVGVRGSRQLTRRASFQGAFRYGWSRDPADPSFRFVSTNGTAALQFALARSLSLAGNYALRKIDFPGRAPVRSSERVGLSLTYERALR